MQRQVEFEQVQGIVRYGYRKLTECCFLLLRVQDAGAAKQWLRSAPVTSAEPLAEAPVTALQVAFTHGGLQNMGCPPDLLSQFSMEFQGGLGQNEARARLLGDTGSSAPDHWDWGSGANSADVLLMLYARPGRLADWKRSLQSQQFAQAFRVVAELNTADMDGVEPFGFPDGLSQPEIDWDRRRTPPAIEDTYTNRTALGEFLLGYPNEYNHYTTRPLLTPNDASAELLPAAEDEPGLRDFGRNGCYLVLRTLQQDVAGFWNFVRTQTRSNGGAEELAAAMVGRRKGGAPLAASEVPAPGEGPADSLNRFSFSADPDGLQCPFGAHIRRVNPRNGDLPSPPATGLQRLLTLLGLQGKTLQSDAKASSRFHRILRRGREYGSSAGGAAGLHFICLGANIARQFEFLQSAWIMSTRFDALAGESDPLLGNREQPPGSDRTDLFTLPTAQGLNRVITDMPRFVTVRGGAYFYLPSLPALRYIAAAGSGY